GRAVGGGVVDRYRHVIGHRQAHGERERHRAGVAFRLSYVVDRDARLVVHDGALALAIGYAAVVRVAQVDEEGLVGFADPVADYRDRDGLARLAGGEGQRSALGLVVAAGGGTARGGGEVHGHDLVAGRRQADGEGGVDHAGVAFRHRWCVRDADRRRAWR